MPIVADNIIVERDVIYGRPDGAAVLADVAYPEVRKSIPAILYVHGGRWTSGERIGRLQLYVEDWAKAGYFAMTIDYRLAGTSPAPAGYQDLLTAIRWIHAHADKYSIDPNRIYIVGNSSGGHVVSLAGTLGDGPVPKGGRVAGCVKRRAGGDQHRRTLRAQHAVVGQSVGPARRPDASGSREGAKDRVADSSDQAQYQANADRPFRRR